MNASVVISRNGLDRDKPPRELFAVDREGLTIRDWLDSQGIEEFRQWPTVCYRNADNDGLMRAEWPRTVIGDGDIIRFVEYQPMPQGGQAGQQKAGGIAGIVLGVISFVVGAASLNPLLIYGGLLGVAVGITNLVLQSQQPGGPKDQKTSPTYSLSPEANRAGLGEAQEVVYGRMRIVPKYAEQPFSLYEGQKQFGTGEDTGKQISEQFLYQVFQLTQGTCQVEKVLIGDTDVRGFDEVEWALYGPGDQIDLIPTRVVNSDEVSGQELFGPNHDSLPADPDIPGDHPNGGQIRPDDWDTYFTATSGIQDQVASGLTGVLDGTHVGVLVDSDVDFNALGVANLVGKQIWIGGAQGTNDDVEYGVVDNFPQLDDPATADQSYKLVHPHRLRTIVAYDTHTLYVRPAFDSVYGPQNTGTVEGVAGLCLRYHIRDDFIGGFVVNESGTKINRIVVDNVGTPLLVQHADGDIDKVAVGLRYEARQVNDDGVALADATGEWTVLGEEYVRINRGHGGTTSNDVIGDTTGAAGVAGRRCNVALFGTGAHVHPLAISVPWDVAEGRYEVRGRRTTKWFEKSNYQNQVFWQGLKGYVVEADHKYEGVSVLAMKARASNNLSQISSRQVRVIIKRTIDQYGIARAASLLPFDPIAIALNSSVATVTLAGHQLVPGQRVYLANVTGDPGGILDSVWNDAGGHVITETPSVNTFRIYLGSSNVATAEATAGGTACTVTASAGWYGPSFTANPAWVIADMFRNTRYGAKKPTLPAATIASLRAYADIWTERGDEFNGTFDRFYPDREARNMVARCGRARVVEVNGTPIIVRDEPKAIRTAMFSMRNTKLGTFHAGYRLPRTTNENFVQMKIFDRNIWRDRLVPRTQDLPAGARPRIQELFGVTDAAHANRESLYETAVLKYRRRIPSLTTEYEGYLPVPMDAVSVTNDIPNWGQDGDVFGYEVVSDTDVRITTSEPLVFAASGTHFIAFQKDDGSFDGPHIATQIAENVVKIGGELVGYVPCTTGFEQLPSGEIINRERTRYQFGPSTNWNRDCLVVMIDPQDEKTIEVQLQNDDPRVHSADGVTYVPPPDDNPDPNRVPEAPVIPSLRAILFGTVDDRHIRAAWLAAEGTIGGYIVEQGVSLSYGNRAVAIDADFVVNGPFVEGETVLSFSQEVMLAPDDAAVSSVAGEAALYVEWRNHGVAFGDYVFLNGLPGLAGMAGLDGVAGRALVISADRFKVATDVPATLTAVQLKGMTETWSYRPHTGAVGLCTLDTDSGDGLLPYDYRNGPEIAAGDLISGVTSAAYCFAGAAARQNGSWGRIAITQQLHIDGPSVHIGAPTDNVWVRVRAIGKLLGPWIYARAIPQDAEVLATGVNVELDGTVTPPTEDLGISLRKGSRIVADGTSPLTGLVVRARANHEVIGVKIEVLTPFNQPCTIIVGNEADDDRYMAAGFWVGAHSLATVGVYKRDETSAAGAGGTQLGRFDSDAHSISWKLVASGTAPTVGTAIVRVDYAAVRAAA